MQIEYYIKNVYGKDLYYLKDPYLAINHINLTGTKTITSQQMRDYTDFSSGHITFIETTKN